MISSIHLFLLALASSRLLKLSMPLQETIPATMIPLHPKASLQPPSSASLLESSSSSHSPLAYSSSIFLAKGTPLLPITSNATTIDKTLRRLPKLWLSLGCMWPTSLITLSSLETGLLGPMASFITTWRMPLVQAIYSSPMTRDLSFMVTITPCLLITPMTQMLSPSKPETQFQVILCRLLSQYTNAGRALPTRSSSEPINPP